MINVVIDRSGSMAENGKPMLILNLLRYIRQYIGISHLQFYVLSNQLISVSIDSNLDLELPEILGSFEIEKCISFLLERKTEATIFLSDVFFEMTGSQKRVFKQQKNLVIVAVGADAELSGLEHLNLPVYLAQDIALAIKHAINIFDVQEISPPLQRSDVQWEPSVLTAANKQDEDDDWG